MSRFTFISLIALFLSLAYYFYPYREIRFHCGTQDQLVKQAFKDNLGWLSTAVARPGYVIQLFTNTKTGFFRIIGIDNDFHSCVVMEGIDWQFILQDTFPPIK